MATKKLLDRFENSPKVWTIKGEFDEKGNYNYVTKIYNSIADAHRDNPGISCSHIEDYCNATFFTKQNHWFAYVGYMMAPSITEIINGHSYERVKQEPDKYYSDVRLNEIKLWNRRMWDDIATEFIGSTYRDVIRHPGYFVTDSIIAKTIASLESDQATKFMIGLYNAGWNKGHLTQQITEWCKKNITRNNLLKIEDGRRVEPPILPTAPKPETRFWCTQSYKQENYL